MEYVRDRGIVNKKLVRWLRRRRTTPHGARMLGARSRRTRRWAARGIGGYRATSTRSAENRSPDCGMESGATALDLVASPVYAARRTFDRLRITRRRR